MDKPQWKLQPVSDFNRHKAEWDRINQQGNDSVLLSSDFVQPCLTHFGGGSELLAVARARNETVAMALLEKVGFGRWRTMQPSQAPLGFWLSRADWPPELLLPELAKALPGWVLSISLTQQDPEILPRPQDGGSTRTLDYISTGRLTIPTDFERYWTERSKNVRQNVNKARNRLCREGVEIRFNSETSSDKLVQQVTDYGVLESAGWKRNLGTSVHVDNRQGQFYIDLLRNFMPDRTQVWRYQFDEKLVATDLCLQHRGVLYILKTTYDENWHKYSPAFMMHIDGIRLCVERGLKQIEFYGPAMEWHRKLTDDLRTLYHLNWYASLLIPWLLRWRQRWLRRQLKRPAS